MDKLAVIHTGGKQYVVRPGQVLTIEKIEGVAGSRIAFDQVLLTAAGENVSVGMPTVAGVKVEAEVMRQTKDDKKIVFRYHSKTRYRKLKGHRQQQTQVRIVDIK